MPEPLLIRKACQSDSDVIADIARHTFLDTYGIMGELGRKENMERYIQDHFTIDRIESEIHDDNTGFHLAFYEGQPVGFAKLTNRRLPKGIQHKKCLEIERIYVLKDFQGLRVGKEIVQRIKSLAKDAGYQVIWLQIWQKNLRALQFYQKVGFVTYETASFNFYEEKHQDFVLRYDLYT